MRFRFAPQGGRQWLAALGRLLVLIVVLMSSLLALLQMPGSSFSGPLPRLSTEEERCAERLAGHVRTLAQEIGPRNIWTADTMAETVDYLRSELSAMGYEVLEQSYQAENTTSLNLEVEIRGQGLASEIVVVGAHYDTVYNCPGANDNGSGLAVLLELARHLAASRPERTIRLVAFANEEPPFFLNKSMGSSHYAKQARARQDDIKAMLALETMGFYSDEPGSQNYPFPLGFFYPDQANFIAFAGNIGSRRLVRQAIGAFRRHGHFPSEGLAAPSFVTGIDWSDHWSFWQEGYQAIMVTDTAFYRYAAYHTSQDTPEKLDYERLARVVSGLLPTILELAAAKPEHVFAPQATGRGADEKNL
ncbi:MAG: M28 family peptidase [Thermodesulfobacteriota bacterium]